MFAIIVGGCHRAAPPNSPTERFQVAECALRYMLQKYSAGPGQTNENSAYVLAPGEFAPRLVAAFAGFKPMVTTNIQISTDSGLARNKATGALVKIWNVEVREVNWDNAIAYVSWYEGNLAAGGHTVRLHRKDGRWSVISESMDWVS